MIFFKSATVTVPFEVEMLGELPDKEDEVEMIGSDVVSLLGSSALDRILFIGDFLDSSLAVAVVFANDGAVLLLLSSSLTRPTSVSTPPSSYEETRQIR